MPNLPRPIDEELPDVPAYKQSYFKAHDLLQNWRDFNLALDRMRGLGPNERFAYRQINAAEGGGVPDYSNPNAGAPAAAGITARTLSNLDVPGVDPGTAPQELDPSQWPSVYRAYLDREFAKTGGAATLETIPDPGVAAFVADTAFRGGANGVQMIQQAINRVRRNQGLPTIAADKIFGPDTQDALIQVTAAPEGKQDFAGTLKKIRDARYDTEANRTSHFYDLATQQRVAGPKTR